MECQGEIENHLAKLHLKQGCLVLYEVMSTYLEEKRLSVSKIWL
ncbi:Mobile element protein [Richelia intracellularis]|nr:Mobile element protein [Richelia intracellularis]